MRVEEVTIALFAACNFIRMFAYVPQIYKAATDKNGAAAISYTTWSLFLLANVSTIAYAIVNQSDWWLAACFACNALCCSAILLVAFFKKASHSRAQRPTERSTSGQLSRLFASLRPSSKSARKPIAYYENTRIRRADDISGRTAASGS